MNPRERVRIIVATAHAVIDGRLDARRGAETLRLQQDQITPHLRGDRIDVTQTEADQVALTLRRLAEQISELSKGADNREHVIDMARVLGEIAQILR